MSVQAITRELAPSEAVIEAVASREGVDPLDLDRPLFEAIDPDALDALAGTAADDSETAALRIEFAYLGYRVVVSSDGPARVFVQRDE